MVIVVRRKCKWKVGQWIYYTNSLSTFQSVCKFSSHSLKVRMAEVNKAIENTKMMEESNRRRAFAHMESKNDNASHYEGNEAGAALWTGCYETSASAKPKVSSLTREVSVPSPSVEALWTIFFADPSKWFDNRKLKKNYRFPDFKHKDTSESLWLIDKRAPAWALLKVNDLRDEAFGPSLIIEELWKSLFANPSKWLDYRKIKKSNKHPDFKHKDTHEALWIDRLQTPVWVALRLNKIPIKAFASSKNENLWKTFFTDPSKWFDDRKIKKSNKHPDFVHKNSHKSLWIEDIKTPTWVTPMLNDLVDEASRHISTENLWHSLFADPSIWVDYRKLKNSNKHPDFVHKDTSEGLWIDAKKTPAWVTPMLNNLQNEAFAPSPSTENLWKALFRDPSKWFDSRKTKKTSNHSDFRHKYSGEVLWIRDKKTPPWVLSKLNDVSNEVFESSQSVEDLWKTLFADPSQWLDNRKIKKNLKSPDFRQKLTREALWIDGKDTPTWVVPKLKDLRDEAFASSPSPEDLWISLFLDQSKWFDYRKNKKSASHLDFVHKNTYEALWIKSLETPAWAKLMLKNLQNEAFAPFSCVENRWKYFFEDPSKWLDYRKVKKNRKHPDFLHKDTREALWIEGKKTPAWVLPKLNNLEFETNACQDERFASYEAK